MILSSIIFFVLAISLPNDNAFISVENPKPFLHYSTAHEQLFLAHKDENVTYLKQLNADRKELHRIGIIHDTDRPLHDFDISISNNYAMVKRESASHPGLSKLKFLSLQKDHTEKTPPDTVQDDTIRRGLYHLVNDSTLYVIRRTGGRYENNMSALYPLDAETGLPRDDAHPLFSFEDNPYWENIIPQDKYRMKAVSNEAGTTCSIFMFASWLLCSKSDGSELFATFEPDQRHFPELEYRVENGVRLYTFPSPPDDTVQNIDLAVDSRHVYVLASGEEITRFELRRAGLSAMASGQSISALEYATVSDRIDVYRKSDGEYLGRFTLPNQARALTVSEEHLIVLEDDDEEGIGWIPKSEIFNEID